MLARTLSSLAVTGAGVAVAWHAVQPLLALTTVLLAQMHGLLTLPVIPQP